MQYHQVLLLSADRLHIDRRQQGRLLAVILATLVIGCADGTPVAGITGVTSGHGSHSVASSKTTACPPPQVCGGVSDPSGGGTGGSAGQGATPSPTPTPSPSSAPTPSPTPSSAPTATPTPSYSFGTPGPASPGPTPTPTLTPSPTPTAPGSTPTPTPAVTSSPTPSASPTPLAALQVVVSPGVAVLDVPAPQGSDAPGYVSAVQLAATVTMADGTTNSAVTWASSDTSRATVDASGLVAAAASAPPGQVIVTATASGSTASGSATISIRSDGTVDLMVQ